MESATARFSVTARRHVTWQGLWLAVGCAVFIAAGVALIVRGGPGDVLMGILTIVLFTAGGLLTAARRLSRRPVLELDAEGVRLLAPWPRRPEDDLYLPWDGVTGVCACTRLVSNEGVVQHSDYLHFLAEGDSCSAEARNPRRPPEPWEHEPAVQVRPTWDHDVASILAEIRRLRPELPVDDRRAQPEASGTR